MSDQTNEHTEETSAEYVARMNDFYNKHLPFLRKQGEFMRLKVEVAEAPLRIKIAKIRLAELELSLKQNISANTSSEEKGGKDGGQGK